MRLRPLRDLPLDWLVWSFVLVLLPCAALWAFQDRAMREREERVEKDLRQVRRERAELDEQKARIRAAKAQRVAALEKTIREYGIGCCLDERPLDDKRKIHALRNAINDWIGGALPPEEPDPALGRE